MGRRRPNLEVRSGAVVPFPEWGRTSPIIRCPSASVGARLGWSGPCSPCFDPGIHRVWPRALSSTSRVARGASGLCRARSAGRSRSCGTERPVLACIRNKSPTAPARQLAWQLQSAGSLLAAHCAGVWRRVVGSTMGRGRHPSPAPGAVVCSTHASAPGNTMVS